MCVYKLHLVYLVAGVTSENHQIFFTSFFGIFHLLSYDSCTIALFQTQFRRTMNANHLGRLCRNVHWYTFFIHICYLLCCICFILAHNVQMEYQESEDIYFQILNPDSLKYTYKARLAQNFGSSFGGVMEKVPLVLVEPSDACASIANPTEVRFNVGLVERGGCSFLSKCIEAERNEMKAIIVFDNNDMNDDQYIDMIDDTTSRNCSIPAAFLLGRDGYMIRRQMIYMGLKQVLINIPVNMTMVPVEDQQHPPWVFY